MIDTLGNRASKVLESWAEIATRNPEAIADLDRVYQEIFGERITVGCGSCYQKAFFRIQKYATLTTENQLTNLITMSEKLKSRAFLLKDGIVLQTVFGGDHLTNDNMTDEQAEKLLKSNANFAQYFERIPEGFEVEAEKVAPFELDMSTDSNTLTPENEVDTDAPIESESEVEPATEAPAKEVHPSKESAKK